MASQEQSRMDRLCSGLGEYYIFMNNLTYYKLHQQGKFRKFCEENGYDAYNIAEEFKQDAEDCMLCDFDKDNDGNNIFPLEEKLDDELSKNEFIFKILKNIYFYGHFNHYSSINIDDWKFSVDPKREEQILVLYKKYIYDFETQFTANVNLIHFLSMSPINDCNFPFLLSVVDCYTRDRIDFKCIHKKDLNKQDWIQIKQQVKYLNNKCLNVKTKCGGHLDLKSAIARYQQRIAPQFSFDPPYLINDSLKQCAVYIIAFGKFVNLLMSAQKILPPFMIDFMIILPPTVSVNKIKDNTIAIHTNNEDNNVSDDDKKQEHENKKQQHENKDYIGDIISDLESTKCMYYKTNIKQQIDVNDMEPLLILRTKIFQNALCEFSTNLSEAGHNTLSYPQRERFCVIVDRRQKTKLNLYTKTEYANENELEQKQNHDQHELDNLIFFQPPNDCNSLPNGSYPPEIYFERSKQCLLPKSEKKNRITSHDNVCGQLLTFSFHVRATDNVKCYMYWNGQCMRFYPSDIINVLPIIFDNNVYGNKQFVCGKSGKSLVSQMNINDLQFERFYCGLSNKQLHEFPIKYKVHFEQDD